MNKYVFKPYRPSFPALFENEKHRISTQLTMVIAIEHIGSTAVPNLGGKGIIDIAIAVRKEDLELASKQLQQLGYEFRPNFSTAERLYFVAILPDAEEGTRRYHVHLLIFESKEWKELLNFRDFLRSHPETAQEYAELKKRAAIEANQNGEKYRKLKESFFKRVLTEILIGGF